MEKLPWMQFHTGDWLKDPRLSMCQPATRGIWTDAVAAMHENSRSGQLDGTPCQLARICRCSESEFMDALHDLQSTGTADVTLRHNHVTLINRRMKREANIKEGNRMRKQKSRGNGKCHSDVPQKSPLGVLVIGSSSVSLLEKKGSGGEEEIQERFKRFWDIYPRREAKQNAWKSFQKLNPDDELLSVMILWIGRACESEQWQDKSKIPHAATLLNQRRWEDDPPPPPQNSNGGKPNAINSRDGQGDSRAFGGPAYIPKP
jgi:hypothetical protein